METIDIRANNNTFFISKFPPKVYQSHEKSKKSVNKNNPTKNNKIRWRVV
jgi:hypothetical protein